MIHSGGPQVLISQMDCFLGSCIHAAATFRVLAASQPRKLDFCVLNCQL